MLKRGAPTVNLKKQLADTPANKVNINYPKKDGLKDFSRQAVDGNSDVNSDP